MMGAAMSRLQRMLYRIAMRYSDRILSRPPVGPGDDRPSSVAPPQEPAPTVPRWGAPTTQCGSVGPGETRELRFACLRERWRARMAAETARHADATARVDAMRETAEALAAEREEPTGRRNSVTGGVTLLRRRVASGRIGRALPAPQAAYGGNTPLAPQRGEVRAQ